jgi:hypothetical protein
LTDDKAGLEEGKNLLPKGSELKFFVAFVSLRKKIRHHPSSGNEDLNRRKRSKRRILVEETHHICKRNRFERAVAAL